MKNKFLIVSVLVVTVITSCKKNDKPTTPAVDNTTSITVNFSPSAPFTFFSFKDNKVIANTDSASAKWDFGLRLTTFIVNSNASGPGNAGVIVQDGIYENITQAPASGYAYDTAAGTVKKLAIKDGTWYTYNVVTHAFVPNAGKVFIFRTADNKYAKMEILETTYEPFTGPNPQRIIYKIRFAYQGDGSFYLKNQ